MFVYRSEIRLNVLLMVFIQITVCVYNCSFDSIRRLAPFDGLFSYRVIFYIIERKLKVCNYILPRK